MTDTRLPMTVIGGYLGAGKTTLINRLLTEPHGKRLAVMVNDFGAINIDAELLESADEDTMRLTNGCVCCTMGADLFMAIGDMLKRSPRPDHLVIEASGIADPQSIANAAIAEPEMRYGGIVTVVDGLAIQELMSDAMIGAQVRGQIACADLVLVSKIDELSDGLRDSLAPVSRQAPMLSGDADTLTGVLLSELGDALPKALVAPHPAYVQWGYTGARTFERPELATLLANRPTGLFRVKGMVRGKGDKGWLVQVVGKDVSVTTIENPAETMIVGIGLKSAVTELQCSVWWQHGQG